MQPVFPQRWPWVPLIWRRSGAASALSLLLAALVLTLTMLWPYPAQIADSTLDIGDALQQATSIRWFQERLIAGGQPLNVPSTYPYARALVLYQPVYTSAVLSLPLYALDLAPVTIYNTLIVLTFVLSCWAVALLVRFLTGQAAAGLVAGVLYSFSSVRLAHLAHLNVLNGCWTVFLLLLLLRLRHRSRARAPGLLLAGGLVALLVAAQSLADVYNGVFMVVALGLLAVYQLTTRCWRLRHYLALLAGGLLGLLICLPVILPTQAAWAELQLERNLEDHEHFSARLENYLVAAHSSALGYDLRRFQRPSATSGGPEHTLWPGLMTLGLATVGLVFARRRQRRHQLFFVLLLAITFYFSLGPTIRLSGEQAGLASLPYRWLYHHVPLFSAVRAASRWALLVQLCLAVLAGYGAAALLRPCRRVVRVALVLALLALAVADSWPASIHGTSEIVADPVPQVYQRLAQLPDGAVLEWPMQNADPVLAHRYVYYTLWHGHPIVNSASSILPSRYLQLQDLLRDFPDIPSVQVLAELGVRYVNVNRWEISGWQTIAARLAATPGLRLIGEYEQGRYYLYEIVAHQPSRGAPLADLYEDGGRTLLSLQVSAPIWVRPAAGYYAAARPTPLDLDCADGLRRRVSPSLPALLLPSTYLWEMSAKLQGPCTITLGSRIARVLDKDAANQFVQRPTRHAQLVVRPLPGQVMAGDRLACRLYGKGPIDRQKVILSLSLMNVRGEIAAKEDLPFTNQYLAPNRWPAEEFSPLSCFLRVPANLPPGTYHLAVALFDPSLQSTIPVAGPDGTVVPFWLIPEPIEVTVPGESG